METEADLADLLASAQELDITSYRDQRAWLSKEVADAGHEGAVVLHWSVHSTTFDPVVVVA